MRWFIFILAFLPNLVSADKATRDEYIEALSSLVRCAAALAPMDPDTRPGKDQKLFDKARENRLIMQFEIDEIFYSEDNLTALHKTFLKFAEEKLTSIGDADTFSVDERKYLQIKFTQLIAETEPFIDQLLESHKFHAGFIRQCAQSYNLTD